MNDAHELPTSRQDVDKAPDLAIRSLHAQLITELQLQLVQARPPAAARLAVQALRNRVEALFFEGGRRAVAAARRPGRSGGV